VIAPGVVVAANIAKINPAETVAQGMIAARTMNYHLKGIRTLLPLNIPNLSANKFGKMRPSADPPFIIDI
jgi:hypothetical protein